MYKINQNFRRLLKFKIYHTDRYYSIYNDSFNEQILTILNNKFDNNKLSHSLLVQASDAIDAGNGVKLVGNDVDINQVISLYPGAYFPPPPVWTLMSSDGESLAIKSANQFVKKLHNYGNYDKKNEYQMNCNAFGGYIDGYYHINNKLISNPYCVGHLINHPPKGTKPNVMKKEFLWKNIFHNNNNNYEYLRSLVKDINYVGIIINRNKDDK